MKTRSEFKQSDDPAGNRYGPSVRSGQPNRQAQQRTLPCSVGSDDRHVFAMSDRKRDVPECVKTVSARTLEEGPQMITEQHASAMPHETFGYTCELDKRHVP